jgi:hypothetical protein
MAGNPTKLNRLKFTVNEKQPMLDLDNHWMNRIKGPESHEGTTRVNNNYKGRLTTRKQETKSIENSIKFRCKDASLRRQATHISAIRKNNRVANTVR